MFGGDHFAVYTDVKLQSHTPEIYVMLYTNFPSIKKNREKMEKENSKEGSQKPVYWNGMAGLPGWKQVPL